VWGNLTPDQRLAGIAAVLLLVSMLLPWYQETGNALVRNRLVDIGDSKNAFQVYSFVEAAIFVVTAGVVALLWARGERKAFHLPGGDGTVIMAAGLWVMFLIFYRQLDKPDGRQEGPISTAVGVDWGIFVAFVLGALLAYAGYRIRASHVPEPPADDAPPASRPRAPAPQPASGAHATLWEDAPASGERARRTRDRSEDTTIAGREAPGRPSRDPSEDPTVAGPRAGRPPSRAEDPSEDPTAEQPGRPARELPEPLEGQLSFDEPAEYRPPPRGGGRA